MSLDIPQWSRSTALYIDEVKDFLALRTPMLHLEDGTAPAKTSCDVLMVACDNCSASFFGSWLVKAAKPLGVIRAGERKDATSELDEDIYSIAIYTLANSSGLDVKLAVPNIDIPNQFAPVFARSLIQSIAPTRATFLFTSIPISRYVPESVSRTHIQTTSSIVAPYLLCADNSAGRAAGFTIPSPTDTLTLCTEESDMPAPRSVPFRGLRPPNILGGLAAAILEFSEVETLCGRPVPTRVFITLDDLNHYAGESALALEAGLFHAAHNCLPKVSDDVRTSFQKDLHMAFEQSLPKRTAATTGKAVVARARLYNEHRISDLQRLEVEARARLRRRIERTTAIARPEAVAPAAASEARTTSASSSSSSLSSSPSDVTNKDEKKKMEVKELEESRLASQTHHLKKPIPNIFA